MNQLDLRPPMALLLRYYSETGQIPSRSGLARLWGYRSRAWADKVAGRMVDLGFLVRRENGRLAPGPRFDLPPPQVRSRVETAFAGAALPEATEARILAAHLVGIAALVRPEQAADPTMPADAALVLDVLRAQVGIHPYPLPLLCEHLHLSPAQLLPHVHHLVRLGLVTHEVTPAGDGTEAEAVRLTATGHRAASPGGEIGAPVLRTLQLLGARDRASLLRTLAFVHRSLEAKAAEGTAAPAAGQPAQPLPASHMR